MASEKNISKLRIDEVRRGGRPSDALAIFQDFNGGRHFLRVDRGCLLDQDGHTYLPITIVHVNPLNLVLIELPYEAETGAKRFWVKQDQVDRPVEVLQESARPS
jgi:hypothetical protein